MKQAIWRSAPALAISSIALFVAMGGSVYAAKQAKINGKTIRAKSLPGNRLKPRSVPANRLKPGVLKEGVLQAVRLDSPLTGAEINELTLGQVPAAAHADSADFAESAGDAQTALNAVNAVDSQAVNGYRAGCGASLRLFAGSCWQSSPSDAKATAPVAARACATQGGTLPEALQLAAFAVEPGVNLDEGDEWSGDLTNVSGLNVFAVVTVSAVGGINSALSDSTRKYRCVLPLLR
jgi:hypothetical protein